MLNSGDDARMSATISHSFYSLKDGVKPPSLDEIHQALADRLVVIKDGTRTKMTLDEARSQFTIKLFGIGSVRMVGVTENGMTQYRADGWLKDDRNQRVAVYLDLPKGEDPHSAATALYPTVFFWTSVNTDTVVPPEVKGKLLTAEEADELEPPRRVKQTRRA
jgi:hypothetical protein